MTVINFRFHIFLVRCLLYDGQPGSCQLVKGSGLWLCLYLQVILRVPVRVEDDAGVCSCEVDPQASSSRTQEENKAVRVGLTEAVDGGLSQVPTHTSIYSFIQVPATQSRVWEELVSIVTIVVILLLLNDFLINQIHI